MPIIIPTSPWWPQTNATTTTSDDWYRIAVQAVNNMTGLGIYNQILLQQQTNPWTPGLITSQTTGTGWPAYYYGLNFPEAFDVQMPPARHRTRGFGRSPAIIHAGRRAVRRSIDLYLRLRPEEELKRFISGREIIVQGVRFRYSLRKTYSIMEHTMSPMGGHVPYRLVMLEPDLAEPRPLASGCVFLDRTPVLDQVLAFIMHVTDPDGEREIIRRTNWSPHLPDRIRLMLDAEPVREMLEALQDAA